MVCIAKRISAGITAALFALFAVTVPINATAAVSSAVATIPGYASGAYQSSSPLSLVSNAFNVNSVVQVGGKAVTVPAAMRLASNAPSFAVAALRLNPTTLIGSAVAAWLLTNGLEYANNEWAKKNGISDPNGPIAGYQWISGFATSWGTYDAAKAAIIIANAAVHPSWVGPYPPAGCNPCAVYMAYDGGQVAQYSITGRAVGNIPAVEADFAPLQVAALPDAVAGELIQKTPLPVIQPQLQPIDVPISEPRLDPVTNRQVQDVARITPAPTPANPLNVETQTFTKDVQSGGTPAPTTDKFPDDYNREVTQKEISATQKEIEKEIKAASAPDKPDWNASIETKKTDLNKEIKDAAELIPTQHDAEKNKFFSWVWTPPVGTCQSIAGGTVRGASFAGWNICGPVGIVRDAMGYLLAVFSSVVIYSQLFRNND